MLSVCHSLRTSLVALCVAALLLTSCASKEPGQSTLDATAQRLAEVLPYTIILVQALPPLIDSWEAARVVSAARAVTLRLWVRDSLSLLGTAQIVLDQYRKSPTPETQLIAALSGVLTIMTEAVRLIYGGTP